MYKYRLTIFIDILGFRDLISKTNKDENLTILIFNAVKSMITHNINYEVFGQVNKEIIKDEKELLEVEKIHKIVSDRMKESSTVQITHFSDSIVLSSELDNEINTMSLIELLARLNYRLWKDYKILIRGGVTMGKLIHEENGPLFGPAMVTAYDIESKLSNFPRIIIDEPCSNYIKNTVSYKAMKKLFLNYRSNEGDKLKIENGLEINLATSFNHLLNSHYTANSEIRKQYFEVLGSSVEDLSKIKENANDDKVKSKYDYIINKLQDLNIQRHV